MLTDTPQASDPGEGKGSARLPGTEATYSNSSDRATELTDNISRAGQNLKYWAQMS